MIEQLLDNNMLWSIWILQFIVIEFRAIFNKKPGDTFTEVVRYIFGFSKTTGETQSNGMRLRRLSFYGLTIFLILHIKGSL